jgi:hypothetical protein
MIVECEENSKYRAGSETRRLRKSNDNAQREKVEANLDKNTYPL